MASIFKRKQLRKVPEGADITTNRKGVKVAKWRDKRGRLLSAPLNDAGDKIVVEAKKYTIAYYDHAGRRIRVAGVTDRSASQYIAGKIEADVPLRNRGVIDPQAEALVDQGRRSIAVHLGDYRAKLTAAGKSQKHLIETTKTVEVIAAFCGFNSLVDIESDAVNRYVGQLAANGSAPRTINKHLGAIKAFTRWLVKQCELPYDSLASVTNPSPIRQIDRRMMLHEEFQWLVDVSEVGPQVMTMTGHDRVLLYATAVHTGLRSNELRSLTRARLHLYQAPPFIVCKARATKNAKDYHQHIDAELADQLRQHVAKMMPSAQVFKMPAETRVAKMFRTDLAAARQAWLAQASDDPAEHARRQDSEFLCPDDHGAGLLDFHALRHTTGAWLALGGAQPNEIKAVMRHSTITLTMDTYGHLLPGQSARIIERMPKFCVSAQNRQDATRCDSMGQ